MSDGAFRRDGTFVPLAEPDAAALEKMWRRMVLAEFVRRGSLAGALGVAGSPPCIL